MKNTSKIILTAFMLVGLITSSVSAAFPDVPTDHIYSDAIEYVKSEGIVSGFSDGEFKPERTITRAEFTKIIINQAFDSDDIFSCGARNHHYEAGASFPDYEPWFNERVDNLIFVDIRYSSENGEQYPFYEYLCMAKEKGILSGYPDGEFKPEDEVTVGEASKIISNAYGFTNVQSGPEGEVFKPFVDALAERNALPEELISIVDNLQRGQMVEIIYRIEKNIANKNSTRYNSIKWIKYSQPVYGYSLLYPSDWDIEYVEILESNPVPPCSLLRISSPSGYSVELSLLPETSNLNTSCRTGVGVDELHENALSAEFLGSEVYLDSYNYSFTGTADFVFYSPESLDNSKFYFEFYKDQNPTLNHTDVVNQKEYSIALGILKSFSI